MLVKVELIVGIAAGSLVIIAFMARAFANMRAGKRAQREAERERTKQIDT